MAQPRLVQYIKQQLNAGYDINKVRNYLVQQGYDSREINEAVDFIYGKKPVGLNLMILVAAGVGFLLIIFLFFFLFEGEKEQVDTSVSDVSSSVGISEIPETVKSEKVEIPEKPIIDKNETSTFIRCPISCDDRASCTEDYCSAATDYECVNEILKPCCGNKICEIGEDYIRCSSDCSAISERVDSSVTEIDLISELDNLDEDLDMSDLDELDQAFDDFDW